MIRRETGMGSSRKSRRSPSAVYANRSHCAAPCNGVRQYQESTLRCAERPHVPRSAVCPNGLCCAALRSCVCMSVSEDKQQLGLQDTQSPKCGRSRPSAMWPNRSRWALKTRLSKCTSASATSSKRTSNEVVYMINQSSLSQPGSAGVC